MSTLPKPDQNEVLIAESESSPRYAFVARVDTLGLGELWCVYGVRMDESKVYLSPELLTWDEAAIYQEVVAALGTSDFDAEIWPANCERAEVIKRALEGLRGEARWDAADRRLKMN
jgi:hypothetical protein